MFDNKISQLCTFLLVILLTETKQIIKNPSAFTYKQGISQKLSKFQCAYDDGTINNSTVIELGNCNGLLYYIGMTLGTGTPQTFDLQFDTGSPTTWVPLGNAPSEFKPQLSSTYQISSKQNNITYGDGSYANGYMGSDILAVQGTSIKGNNTIMWANDVSEGFFAGTPDIQGLVAMDYGSYPNFLDIAYQKNQISTSAFSIQLNFVNQTSYLYYNNGLPQSIVQQMSWIPQQQNPNGYWQTSVTSVILGDVNLTLLAPSSAMIDTGTQKVIFNPTLYNAVVSKFFSTPQCFNDPNNSNLRTCYCNSSWPAFVFNFSSTMSVNLTSLYYKLPSSYGSGYCFMAIFSRNSYQIILGNVFMRSYIITFDRINNRMGFYNKGNPVNGSNSGTNGEVFNTFDPIYFVAMQYVMGFLSVIVAIVGLVLWKVTKERSKDKLQKSNLGVEMM